jgi:hypothetical protein
MVKHLVYIIMAITGFSKISLKKGFRAGPGQPLEIKLLNLLV